MPPIPEVQLFEKVDNELILCTHLVESKVVNEYISRSQIGWVRLG